MEADGVCCLYLTGQNVPLVRHAIFAPWAKDCPAPPVTRHPQGEHLRHPPPLPQNAPDVKVLAVLIFAVTSAAHCTALFGFHAVDCFREIEVEAGPPSLGLGLLGAGSRLSCWVLR